MGWGVVGGRMVGRVERWGKWKGGRNGKGMGAGGVGRWEVGRWGSGKVL